MNLQVAVYPKILFAQRQGATTPTTRNGVHLFSRKDLLPETKSGLFFWSRVLQGIRPRNFKVGSPALEDPLHFKTPRRLGWSERSRHVWRRPTTIVGWRRAEHGYGHEYLRRLHEPKHANKLFPSIDKIGGGSLSFRRMWVGLFFFLFFFFVGFGLTTRWSFARLSS